MVQGGAGTSTNMNANEVIANRALEIMGHQRGEYEVVGPNSHINLSQSNDGHWYRDHRVTGICRVGAGHLSRITGLDLITAPDLVEATSDTGVFVQVSGVLKQCAVKLSKICNDLRLLSSGPRAGLGEINLPPMQPGSSIMPVK